VAPRLARQSLERWTRAARRSLQSSLLSSEGTGFWSVRGRARGSHSIAEVGGQLDGSLAGAGLAQAGLVNARGMGSFAADGRRSGPKKRLSLTRRPRNPDLAVLLVGIATQSVRSRMAPLPRPNTPRVVKEGAPLGRARDRGLSGRQDRAGWASGRPGSRGHPDGSRRPAVKRGFARRGSAPRVTRSVECSCRVVGCRSWKDASFPLRAARKRRP
jgi:hypothetical protein